MGKAQVFIKVMGVFTALSGCFSVLFGAWLAHAGQDLLAVEKARLVTAHQYQIIHTLALLIVVLAYRVKPAKALIFSGILFFTGLLLFSGSLYLKTFTGIASFSTLTPTGGIVLSLGWLSLVFLGKEAS